tara:strand:+ start:907 stop:1131 length:225 start_codon:yes stop_codon:yes gene_type:complete
MRNNSNKKNNVESQRLNEFSIHSGKKKSMRIVYLPPQILHSSLAAFWYGACPAFIMPPVGIGSSLHLPIFFITY